MADSNESNDSNEDRSPGLSRMLSSKMIAAGLFVVIGTAGVVYAVKVYHQNKTGTEIAQGEESGDNIDGAESPASTLATGNAGSNLKPITSSSTLPDSNGGMPAKNSFPTATSNPKSNPLNTSVGGGGFKPASTKRVTTQRPVAPPSGRQQDSQPNNIAPPLSSRPTTSNQFSRGGQTTAPISPRTMGQMPSSNGGSAGEPKRQFTNNIQIPRTQTVDRGSQSTDNSLAPTGISGRNSLRGGSTGKPASQQTPLVAPIVSKSFGAPADRGSGGLRPPAQRASFDASQELKPFAAGAATNNPSQGVNTFAATPSATTSPVPTLPNRGVLAGATQGRPVGATIGNNPRAQTPGGFSSNISNPGQLNPSGNNRIRSAGQSGMGSVGQKTSPLREGNGLGTQRANQGIAATSVATTKRLTRPTPGDRRLEGMQAPSVTIEKIAPTEIQVNQAADFQLVVKNVGRSVAKDVRVFDEIPAGTEFVQAVPQPRRGPGNQVSWELDSLAPGQEKRIKLQLKPTNPGEIGSVAEVTFTAQASMRTKVTKPILAIQHTMDPQVLIGDMVRVSIDVKNEGDGPAKNVVIQEGLPEGLEFSEGFRELEYAIGTLGPGQSKNVRLELRAAKIGKYRNVLQAHAEGGLKTQHAVNIEIIAPKLEASGEGPKRRFLNREATHRFAVRNSGTANATNVELVCRLPNGLRFVTANNRGKYDENTHAVYWSLAELNDGLVANVEVTTRPTEPGNQDLKFQAFADLNQSTDAICKLAVEHLVDVFFDIDDVVDPIEIGSETSYKLRIVNQGTKTATNVQLQVQFPAAIQPLAVTGNINHEIRGQQIAFSPITSLNPRDEIVIMITGKGISAGDHRVVVNLATDGREANVSKQESTRVYSDR